MSSSLPLQFQQTVQLPASGAPVDNGHVVGPAMQIVAGSQPGLSTQTDSVLRDRLRIGALVLAFGFGVFFIKGLFAIALFQTVRDWLIFWTHLTVLVIEVSLGLRLCTQCPKLWRRLRLAELLIFGAPAAFFAILDWAMLQSALQQGTLYNVAPGWMLLIFTYALFIPNHWQRAARVIGTLASIPVALLVWLSFNSAEYARVVALKEPHHWGAIEVLLTMLLTSVAAIMGVHTINRLRREVFAAQQIGQYRLKRKLGAGGMGEVHLAEHMLLKRPCAIKLIRPDKAGDPQALARFEREVQETAKLTHWNSIEIFDYGHTADGTFYYVMEYLPGMNLEQLVQMHGPLPAGRVIYLLTQVCDALAEAHGHGMIHRDLKPANIFAAKRGGVYDVAKLLDFGLVKTSGMTANSGLTQEGMVAGSPLYMSPEQATGDTVDERSDIYSLGLVAYYLLTGRSLFEDEKPIKVLLAHAHEDPSPPSQLNPEVPHDLDEVVLRCLEKLPELRFQSVTELAAALNDCRAAGDWSRDQALAWWQNFGCPMKKQLDAQVLEGALV